MNPGPGPDAGGAPCCWLSDSGVPHPRSPSGVVAIGTAGSGGRLPHFRASIYPAACAMRDAASAQLVAVARHLLGQAP